MYNKDIILEQIDPNYRFYGIVHTCFVLDYTNKSVGLTKIFGLIVDQVTSLR